MSNSRAFYIIWGYGQKASDGTPLVGRYATFNAGTQEEANEIAKLYWGAKYGRCTSDFIDAGVTKYKLERIDLNYELKLKKGLDK